MSALILEWQRKPSSTFSDPAQLTFTYGVTEGEIQAMADGLKRAGYRNVHVLRQETRTTQI